MLDQANSYMGRTNIEHKPQKCVSWSWLTVPDNKAWASLYPGKNVDLTETQGYSHFST